MTGQPYLTDEELRPMCDFYGITIEQGRANHAKVMSQGDDPTRPICIGCAQWPEEIGAYRDCVKADQLGPDDDPATFVFAEPSDDEVRRYVISNEGTFNPRNGHFLCDSCYIKNGMPTSSRGWVCP